MAKKKKKSSGVGIMGLLLALVVGAGYFFRDCLPNVGMGGGAGTSTSSSPEDPSDKPTAEKPAGEKGPLLVTVRGEECMLGDAKPAPCAQVCETVKGANPPTTQIQIDDTVGAHAVVEEFKTCLVGAGFSDVKFQSE